MEQLKKLLRRTKRLKKNQNNLYKKIFNKRPVKDEIIRLNTDEQLFEKGLNANNVSLESIGGAYSPVTVLIKQEQSLPFDRVTLYDTGAFYGSFKVFAETDGFVIEADTAKEGADLRERWGPDILGLTDESKNELSEQLKKELIEIVKAKIL